MMFSNCVTMCCWAQSCLGVRIVCQSGLCSAVYVNLVEHPARISCGVPLAVTEWRPSYKRGTLMQAPLAVIGSLSAFISWWLDRSVAWLVGGVLLALIIPFTL